MGPELCEGPSFTTWLTGELPPRGRPRLCLHLLCVFYGLILKNHTFIWLLARLGRAHRGGCFDAQPGCAAAPRMAVSQLDLLPGARPARTGVHTIERGSVFTIAGH